MTGRSWCISTRVTTRSTRPQRPSIRRVQVKPIGQTDVCGGLRSLATALKDVHLAQLVHQDVTPPNVADRGDWGVLLDLGMARFNQELMGTTTRQTLTLDYAPPERLRPSYRALPASDVYQWAACVLTVATGRRPYSQTSHEGVLQAIVAGPPDVSGAPDWLQPVLRRALQSAPSSRPSADALVSDVRTLGQEQGWKPSPTESARPPQPSRSLPSEYGSAVLVGAACVLLLVGGSLAAKRFDLEGDGQTVAQPPPTDSSGTTTSLPPGTTSPPTSHPTTEAPTTTAAPASRWPTSSDEAPSTLYAMFGVEATEASASPTGHHARANTALSVGAKISTSTMAPNALGP